MPPTRLAYIAQLLNGLPEEIARDVRMRHRDTPFLTYLLLKDRTTLPCEPSTLPEVTFAKEGGTSRLRAPSRWKYFTPKPRGPNIAFQKYRASSSLPTALSDAAW